MAKSNLGEGNTYLAYTCKIQSITEENEGRTEAPIWSGNHEGRLLDAPLPGLQTPAQLTLRVVQAHLPGGLGSPASINKQDNPPQTFPQSHLMQAKPQFRLSS